MAFEGRNGSWPIWVLENTCSRAVLISLEIVLFGSQRGGRF
ncbi:hypothetical protein CLOSTMETH_02780 [[Clostridium] methylpentosum DSM 5476]|uniref:Uncharacterized protein n=1 Tax=[Clostridium] methylpentosum DSM 5476 TaxID=537013 RepID=C0EFY8_9FIRM|nr:hypothetical protein CLOSTMETH_02780 [[Clostridium] methylpentosum DSM 5476]